MNAESITAIVAPTPPLATSQFQQVQPGATPGASAIGTTTSFGDMVSTGLGQVNQQLLASQVDLQQLAVGNVQNLHQIMIRLEESRLTFQLAMQVRSRVLEAYQDVMKMPI